jgi:hypothetical protein
MKNTTEDLIMAEMHAIKDANSARLGHDFERLFRHLQKEFAEMPSIKHRKSISNKSLRATGRRNMRLLKRHSTPDFKTILF